MTIEQLLVAGLLCSAALLMSTAFVSASEPAWPSEVKQVKYLSAADNTMQPTLFYKPESGKPAPLLVALHTWSCDYMNPPEPAYANWCIAKGWVFVHPNFRGPNNNPHACGSELAVQDILSVVDYARKNANVDPERIYLVGVSGGGYMTMLMAGRAPHLWAAASAWCGLYDLNDWYDVTKVRNPHYAGMIVQCCGGAPGSSADVDEQYRIRSPSAWLSKDVDLPTDINTGIKDGHQGSVPNSQSLDAFNALAAQADRLDVADIEYITKNATIPASLTAAVDDPVYARAPVLFRRISGNVRVSVFNGGHEILPEAALAWLELQHKSQPANWDVKPDTSVDLNGISTKASK